LIWLTLLATSASAPASAIGSSLLSGYGGPGEGSQVILGSTLLGGGATGGGGAGTGGSGGAGSTTAEGGSARGGSGSTSARHRGERSPTVKSSKAVARRAGAGARAVHAGEGPHRAGVSGARPDAYPSASAERAYLASSGSAAGVLSGDLVWYVLLGLGVLAVTGGVTRWLVANRGHADDRSLKAQVGGSE
jgi:hypothetical protein